MGLTVYGGFVGLFFGMVMALGPVPRINWEHKGKRNNLRLR